MALSVSDPTVELAPSDVQSLESFFGSSQIRGIETEQLDLFLGDFFGRLNGDAEELVGRHRHGPTKRAILAHLERDYNFRRSLEEFLHLTMTGSTYRRIAWTKIQENCARRNGRIDFAAFSAGSVEDLAAKGCEDFINHYRGQNRQNRLILVHLLGTGSYLDAIRRAAVGGGVGGGPVPGIPAGSTMPQAVALANLGENFGHYLAVMGEDVVPPYNGNRGQCLEKLQAEMGFGTGRAARTPRLHRLTDMRRAIRQITPSGRSTLSRRDLLFLLAENSTTSWPVISRLRELDCYAQCLRALSSMPRSRVQKVREAWSKFPSGSGTRYIRAQLGLASQGEPRKIPAWFLKGIEWVVYLSIIAGIIVGIYVLLDKWIASNPDPRPPTHQRSSSGSTGGTAIRGSSQDSNEERLATWERGLSEQQMREATFRIRRKHPFEADGEYPYTVHAINVPGNPRVSRGLLWQVDRIGDEYVVRANYPGAIYRLHFPLEALRLAAEQRAEARPIRVSSNR